MPVGFFCPFSRKFLPSKKWNQNSLLSDLECFSLYWWWNGAKMGLRNLQKLQIVSSISWLPAVVQDFTSQLPWNVKCFIIVKVSWVFYVLWIQQKFYWLIFCFFCHWSQQLVILICWNGTGMEFYLFRFLHQNRLLCQVVQ